MRQRIKSELEHPKHGQTQQGEVKYMGSIVAVDAHGG